jgi:hypothetical protein
MTLFSRIKSWMRHTLGRSRSESEMADEMRFHMDAYTEDLVRRGVARPEAASNSARWKTRRKSAGTLAESASRKA